MSYVREAFFDKVCPSYSYESLGSISMVTVDTEYEHFKDSVFGDDIEVKIFTEAVRKISFDVVFEFYRAKSQEMLGVGKQTLVFLSLDSGRHATIPAQLYVEIKKGERRIEQNL